MKLRLGLLWLIATIIAPKAHGQILKTSVESYRFSHQAFNDIPGGELRIVPSGPADRWVILLSANLSSQSGSDSVEVQYFVDGTLRGVGGIQNTVADRGASWQHFYLATGIASPYVVTVQSREKIGIPFYATVADLQIIAFRVPAGADLHYAENNGLQAVPGTAWNSYLNLNVTPSAMGDYLIFATASTTELPNNGGLLLRLQDPAAAFWPIDDGVNRHFLNDRSPWWSFFVARRQNLSPPGPHTYTIQGTSAVSGGGQMQYQRIMAFRTDAFELYEGVENTGASATTSTTPVVKSTLATTAPPGHRDYLVIQSEYIYAASTATDERRAGLEHDNVEQSSYRHTFNNGATRVAYAYFDRVTTDASVLYENTFSTSNAAYTVNSKESVIHTLRFPTSTLAAEIGIDTKGGKEGGLSWGDFNEDDCLDLLAHTRDDTIGSRLYLQNKTGTCDGDFTDVSECLLSGAAGIDSRWRSALWGDVNQDGRLDLIRNVSSSTLAQRLIEIYFNAGPGLSVGPGCGAGVPWSRFGSAGAPTQTLDISDIPGTYANFNTEGIHLIDYDADGDLDLMGNNQDEGILAFRNNGSGTFAYVDPTTLGLPGQPSGLVAGEYGAVADIDGDQDVDIAQRIELGVDLYLNGGGTFSAGTFDQPSLETNKGSIIFCDFDADRDMDLLWTENGTNQIWEQTGVGSGSFAATGAPSGITGVIDGAVCGDIDNDGDVDLFLTSDGNDSLFRNDGSFSFTDISPTGFGIQDGQATAMADYDRDGDLDIVVSEQGGTDFWINTTNNDNYVMVRALHDLGGGLSRDAIGASISLLDCEGNLLSGVRDVNGGRGHGAQDPAVVHIGLPTSGTPSGSGGEYIIRVAFVDHAAMPTVVGKAVVPSALGGYQQVDIKDTDANDFSACTTAVTLSSFEAEGVAGGIELSWRTGSETHNLGFHLYRASSPDGPYERVTSVMIPGLGTSLRGGGYRYRDLGVQENVRYFYRLEDIDASGQTTLHGPVSALAGVVTPPSGKEESVSADSRRSERRFSERRPIERSEDGAGAFDGWRRRPSGTGRDTVVRAALIRRHRTWPGRTPSRPPLGRSRPWSRRQAPKRLRGGGRVGSRPAAHRGIR